MRRERVLQDKQPEFDMLGNRNPMNCPKRTV